MCVKLCIIVPETYLMALALVTSVIPGTPCSYQDLQPFHRSVIPCDSLYPSFFQYQTHLKDPWIVVDLRTRTCNLMDKYPVLCLHGYSYWDVNYKHLMLQNLCIPKLKKVRIKNFSNLKCSLFLNFQITIYIVIAIFYLTNFY